MLKPRLARLSGDEVLERMKKDPGLATIPIVIWTIFVGRKEIEYSYKLGAVAPSQNRSIRVWSGSRHSPSAGSSTRRNS